MKLLSIGNSFSQDSHKYLHDLAEYNNIDIKTVNLYIGGCNLQHHCECLKNGNPEYELEINGGECTRKISLADAVKSDIFDIITVQQASYDCGRPQTYFPYIETLVSYCRQIQPQSKIFFHQTWAYEIDCKNDSFKTYGRNQDEMYRRLCDCTETVKKVIGIPVIPTGSVIQNIRENIPEFDYKNGGKSLCRDGFHLSFDYGRLIAAYVWLKSLTGKHINLNGFKAFDETLTTKIQEVIEKFFGF